MVLPCWAAVDGAKSVWRCVVPSRGRAYSASGWCSTPVGPSVTRTGQTSDQSRLMSTTCGRVPAKHVYVRASTKFGKLARVRQPQVNGGHSLSEEHRPRAAHQTWAEQSWGDVLRTWPDGLRPSILLEACRRTICDCLPKRMDLPEAMVETASGWSKRVRGFSKPRSRNYYTGYIRPGGQVLSTQERVRPDRFYNRSELFTASLERALPAGWPTQVLTHSPVAGTRITGASRHPPHKGSWRGRRKRDES